MSIIGDLPDAWEVWSEESDGRLVLAYRPDVFDGSEFPAACLPTLYLTHGRRTRRPGTNPTDTPTDDWYVTLYLEPDVYHPETHRFPSRDSALDCAVDIATRFDDGQIDYRALYQIPRDRYLDRLDELTGS